MSSCSSVRFGLALAVTLATLCAVQPAEAINVHAVYRTACTRELGVILKVEKRTIRLLKLDGTIISVPRHEIVSLAYYPVSQVPLPHLPTHLEVPALRVETLLDGEVVHLATGWPVDFSETKVAFLLDSGKDMVIDKDSIWSLEFVRTLRPDTENTTATPIDFAHPQTAGFCAQDNSSARATRTVFAQQLLNDRVVIKRELDRLAEGYEEVVDFAQDQKFYPVPHVYKDRTALGLWVSMFSRHGASATRTNNFTPMLIDELHLGPFRYQHLFLTGAAPNQTLLHNEAQSQLYYRFKAAYFHASVFADPNLVLVGTKYSWRAADLADEQLDDRVNEIIAIELGFDYGPLAIELTPAVVGQAAVKMPGLFDSTTELNLWRVGIRFTRRLWEAQVFAGATSAQSYDAQRDNGETIAHGEFGYLYGRANLQVAVHPRFEALGSVIYRRLSYEATPWDSNDALTYDSTTVSAAFQGSFALSHRFNIGGNAIVEVQSRRGPQDTTSKRRAFPKIALFTSFSF